MPEKANEAAPSLLDRMAQPRRIRKSDCDSFDEVCKLVNQANINMAHLAKEIQETNLNSKALQAQIVGLRKQHVSLTKEIQEINKGASK